MGIKGDPIVNRNIDTDVIVAEVRETSRKPDEVGETGPMVINSNIFPGILLAYINLHLISCSPVAYGMLMANNI